MAVFCATNLGVSTTEAECVSPDNVPSTFKENKHVFISKESSQFYMKILGTLHAKSENI